MEDILIEIRDEKTATLKIYANYRRAPTIRDPANKCQRIMDWCLREEVVVLLEDLGMKKSGLWEIVRLVQSLSYAKYRTFVSQNIFCYQVVRLPLK